MYSIYLVCTTRRTYLVTVEPLIIVLYNITYSIMYPICIVHLHSCTTTTTTYLIT